MKEFVKNRVAEKGTAENTVHITKTIEIEKSFNEILEDEKRLMAYINYLEHELVRTKESLQEAQDIKAQLSIPDLQV